MSLPALPRGWARATVGDLADYINGLAFKPSDWEAHGRPIIRIQNLTGSSRSFNRTTREVEHRYVVATGDILVSWSATLDAYIWVGPEAVLNQHIFRVLPREGLVDRGLLYWGLKQVIGEMWRGEHTHGSTMKHINRGPFLAHTFNLPPLNEQRRIAAKIEALTARSRAAREALAQVPPLLERFRQSVLAAAFRGDLTAEWRRQHPDVEPASVLLERIRALLRRSENGGEKGAKANDAIVRGELVLDPSRHLCTWKGKEAALTVTEFLILKSLAERPGHVKNRDQLMDAAYGETVYVDDRTIDSHIKRLRKKFKLVDDDFEMIETLYGVGYRFKET